MRLLPLGVGDAFSALHYSSSVLLESAGQWLLLDCPHPIRKILHEGGLRALGRPLDVGDLAGVAVTHLHADHSCGLEGLGFYSHFVLGRRIPLLVHPEVGARLWERLAAGMERLLSPDGTESPHARHLFRAAAARRDARTAPRPVRQILQLKRLRAELWGTRSTWARVAGYAEAEPAKARE
jgi:ribonuclease BN (tRNA processing enzyme)